MKRDILSDIYYEVMFIYKSLYNHQYAIWNDRRMSAESKDEIYQGIYNRMDILPRILADHFADPLVSILKIITSDLEIVLGRVKIIRFGVFFSGFGQTCYFFIYGFKEI